MVNPLFQFQFIQYFITVSSMHWAIWWPLRVPLLALTPSLYQKQWHQQHYNQKRSEIIPKCGISWIKHAFSYIPVFCIPIWILEQEWVLSVYMKLCEWQCMSCRLEAGPCRSGSHFAAAASNTAILVSLLLKYMQHHKSGPLLYGYRQLMGTN